MKQTLLLFLILFSFSCGRSVPKSTEVRPVKSVVAQSVEYVDKDFVGVSSPDNAVNLAFKVAGQILDIPVSTGQRVERGELLAQLDPRDFELALLADLSSFNQASSRLNRAERLLEREAISRQEYEDARMTYDRAKATYENSKDILDQTDLRAPFAAVVERIYFDNYERVQSGQTVLRLVEPLTTVVKFTVPESSLSTITESSTRFSVTFDNYREMHFSATLKDYAVTTSDAVGFPVSLNIKNPSPDIYPIAPGFSCTVTVQSLSPLRGAISLPLSAIYAPAIGGAYVWIVDERTGRVVQRTVSLGELYGANSVIVKHGVESGERVVVAGVYQLRDGDKVKLID